MLTLAGHSGQVTALAFSPDGRWLISAGWDGTVRLWQRPSYRETRRMRTPFDHAVSAAFSHDSRYFGAGFRNRDARSDMTGFASFAWTPVISIAGVDSNTIPSQDTRHPVGPITKIIAPHPRKSLLALYGSLNEIAIWECNGPDCRDLQRLSVTGVVTDLSFSGEGDSLAATVWRGTNDGAIYRWSSWKRSSGIMDVQGDEPTAIAFSPAGETLFSGYASGRLVWWGANKNGSPQTAVASPARILDMAVSPDGRVFLLGCEDGLVRLWDVLGQRLQTTFDWVIGSVGCVAIAPDGLTAAVGGDSEILVWDLDD